MRCNGWGRIRNDGGLVSQLPARHPHLKSLELHGYKTFASRTLFEFGQRITAIVGPNGSGKSNIADAIRWVLGEQSYSLLRGKKTEDMIFSGSESRPRASMASATILFDNSDGWLPIEFAEVSISRRAYRDGQNEYLINGRKVRLREVAELLAEVGLAQRTYTVIGQGLVDAALSLKAEERRRLFEEAAGIGLYRSRREEALRRLEATLHNLERVQDIVAELRPRLRSLERQAERARNYDQVKNDLESALRTWYGYHWHRMLRSVSQAHLEAETAGKDRERLQAEFEAGEASLTAARERIDSLRSTLQSLAQSTTSVHAQRESLGTRLAVIQEKQRWLQQRESELGQALSLADEEHAQLAERRQELSAEREVRARALEAAQRSLTTLSGGEGDPQSQLLAMQERLAAARRAADEIVTRQAASAARLTEVGARIQMLEARREETRATVRSAEQELGERDPRAEEARQRASEAASEAKAAGEREATVREQLAQAGEARQKLERALTEARLGAARLQARLEALASRQQEAERVAQQIQAAVERGELPGWLGVLGRQVQPVAGAETAISAALGDFAEGMALGTSEDVHGAVDWFQSSHLAWEASLAPAVPLRPPAPRFRLEDEDCLGNAADMVRAPQALQPIVELLLGRTLLVRDRSAARRLLGAIPEDVRLVTRAGEVYYAAGHVRITGHGRVGRDLERIEAELRSQFEAAGVQLQQAETEHLGALEAQERAGAAAEQARQALQAATEIERTTAQEAEQAARFRQESQQRVDFLRQRMEEVEVDLQTLDREREATSLQAAAIGDERARMEAELKASSEAVREAGEGDAGTRLRQAEARIQAARQAVEDARAREMEVAERLVSLEAESTSRRARLDAVRTEREGLLGEAADLEVAVRGVEAQLAQVAEQRRPAEEALAASEQERARLEGAERRVRSELQAAEHQHSQTQIDLARRQEELNSLKRRIEDDFGLVAFDYDENTTVQTPLPFDGLVERLPEVESLPLEAESQVERLRLQLRRMGAVNPEAQREYVEVGERVEFMTTQMADLREAEAKLKEVVAELDERMEREFRRTFEAVAEGFHESFTRLFGGGVARLHLTDPDDMTNTGIDIEARLPGRREQGLAMLSGGERSLTACALVFALLRVSPTPLCVLDEVDAMLDEANVARFREMLSELSEQTQFIIITHNRETVQAAQVVYGITMGTDSASAMIGLKLDEADRIVQQQ